MAYVDAKHRCNTDRFVLPVCREEGALAAHAALRDALLSAGQAALANAAATAGSAPSPPPPPTIQQTLELARCLARALRLLSAQLRLIKLDAANSKLAALAGSLKGDGAVTYLRGKFASMFQLLVAAPAAGDVPVAPAAQQLVPTLLPAPRLAYTLGRSTAWLSRSISACSEVEAKLQSVVPSLDLKQLLQKAATQHAEDAGRAIPLNLRSGLRAMPAATVTSSSVLSRSIHTGAPGSAVDESAGAGAELAAPHVPRSSPSAWGDWRSIVRAGIVALAAGDSPAVGPSLAETLLWDASRLHKAQNEFQQVMVVAAGLMLVAQARQQRSAAAAAAAAEGAGSVSGAGGGGVGALGAACGWPAAARDAAKRRLMLQLADPEVSMRHELAGSIKPSITLHLHH